MVAYEFIRSMVVDSVGFINVENADVAVVGDVAEANTAPKNTARPQVSPTGCEYIFTYRHQ
jgi:hypothetical protein